MARDSVGRQCSNGDKLGGRLYGAMKVTRFELHCGEEEVTFVLSFLLGLGAEGGHDFNQQEELVSNQDMMDEQNEFEQDFRDEFTEGAFSSESNQSEDILEAAYAVDSVQDITTLKFNIMQMMNMLKSGISTSQIFGLLASQAGGYEFVGYGPRDMYNEIARQRRQIPDYEIPVFKRKWVQLIEEFGIEDKPWVINMYEEKHMWATAYLRGKFFAGFRTTSRCEGLHSVVGRYVGLRYDLTSFVEHFQRCVAHLYFKEFNADYESTHGVPVMQTCIELLERYAAELYTHEIFLFFRPFLSRAGSMRVLNIDNTDDCIKYTVCVAKSSNPYVHQSGVGLGQPSRKKRQCCSVCQMEGHKKTTCPWQKDIDNNVIEDEANCSDDGDAYPELTAELDSDN
ncbi:hypothetical protein Ahy_A05g025361 [Arachis hypogaea]|uniref:Uncharacterized protein n=1 Tax=Arachis hypogaea TaxID=3818 RepID=A0A445D8H4_ARAHY|nr:hypothetical protein Ahy_A05g025361 [Arachis hypogaea]